MLNKLLQISLLFFHFVILNNSLDRKIAVNNFASLLSDSLTLEVGIFADYKATNHEQLFSTYRTNHALFKKPAFSKQEAGEIRQN